MNPLRQAAFGIALLVALGVLLWTQFLRTQAEDARAELASEQQQQADARIERQVKTISTLDQALQKEREAQKGLRTTINQLRTGASKREQQIKELERENTDLRAWAAEPLPDTARRLRQRPALTGADAYRDWMSGSGSVRSTADGADQ